MELCFHKCCKELDLGIPKGTHESGTYLDLVKWYYAYKSGDYVWRKKLEDSALFNINGYYDMDDYSDSDVELVIEFAYFKKTYISFHVDGYYDLKCKKMNRPESALYKYLMTDSKDKIQSVAELVVNMEGHDVFLDKIKEELESISNRHFIIRDSERNNEEVKLGIIYRDPIYVYKACELMVEAGIHKSLMEIDDKEIPI